MSLQACADLLSRGDPDRFIAAMAAPVPARRVLLPLYAFNLEIARAPWVTAEPMIAEMRLQWWRDALDEIATGAPVRRHEVVTPLADVLDADGARLLDALIAARRHDIGHQVFADDAALAAYIDATAGNLVWVAVRALGAGQDMPAGERIARDFAHGAGLANWLKALPELIALGRRPLADTGAARLSDLARGGLARLIRARRQRRDVPRVAAPAFYPGWQAGAELSRAVRDPARILAGRLQGGDGVRKAGLIWRSATGLW